MAKTLRALSGFVDGQPCNKAASTLDRERERLRSGLAEWDRLLREPGSVSVETLQRGLDIRLQASGQVKDLWIFDHLAEVARFVDMLESLGIPRGRLTVTLRAKGLSEVEIASRLQQLERSGVHATVKGLHPGPARVTISLKAGTKPFSYLGTCDRALEILHIALRAGVYRLAGPGEPSCDEAAAVPGIAA